MTYIDNKNREIINKKYISKNKIFDEELYLWSPLPDYFEHDSWKRDEGLLLITGISPSEIVFDFYFTNEFGAIVNKAQICHGELLAHPIRIFNIPDINEIERKINLLKKDIDEIDSIDAKDEGIRIYKLEELDKLLQMFRDESIRENSLIRNYYETRLGRIYQLWESGDHPNTNPIKYYIDWAKEKNIEIEWLDWAIKNNYYNDPLESSGKNDKPLDPREKATWGRIVKILCLELKLGLDNPFKIAGIIQQMAATHGVEAPAKEDTIVRRLKELPED